MNCPSCNQPRCLCPPLSAREEHLLRAQAALDASVSDPFGRSLTDEHRAVAGLMWQDWRDQRIDAVRKQIREEQRQEQAERDRQAHLLSLPRWRPR